MTEQDSILERLVRMETKLDMALTTWNDRLNDHEGRIRAVESEVTSNAAINRWKATTGLAALLAAGSAALQIFGLF